MDNVADKSNAVGGSTDTERLPPPAAFQCWDSWSSKCVELFAESVWVLACIGFAVLVLLGAFR